MLCWICGHTRLDRVRNDDIRDRLGVVPIEERLIQHQFNWFGHVHLRPPEAPVHRGIIRWDNNVKAAKLDMGGGNQKGLEGMKYPK
jgi:hypothetical protein